MGFLKLGRLTARIACPTDNPRGSSPLGAANTDLPSGRPVAGFSRAGPAPKRVKRRRELPASATVWPFRSRRRTPDREHPRIEIEPGYLARRAGKRRNISGDRRSAKSNVE